LETLAGLDLSWLRVLPTSVTHVAAGNISYKGYHIPRDSIIFMNICKPYPDRLPAPSLMTQTGGIYHHLDYFDEPETFKPEKYLNNPYGTRKV
jgi:hypothetical protein